MCSPNDSPVLAGDIDIYPKDWTAYKKIIYFMVSKDVKVKYESNVATTFAHSKTGPFKDFPPLQIIKPENKGAIVAIGTLQEIINSFDFTVVRGGLVDMTTAMVDDDFITDETKHFLRVKNIHCPISSTLRMMKYAKKGYSTNAVEVMKLFENWENRPYEYKQVLRIGIPKLVHEGAEALSKEEKQKLANLLYVD